MPRSERSFAAIMAAVRRQAPALVVFSLLSNLLLLVGALYMLQVYDRVLASGSMDTLMLLTAMALAAIAVYGLFEQARRLILGRIGAWLENELCGPVIRRSMDARLAGAPGADAGLKDIADLRAFIGGDGILAFLDAPWTPVFLAIVWLLHPGLGMLATGGAVALFVAALANDFLTRGRQQRATLIMRHNQAEALRYVESAETIAPLGMTGMVLARWQAQRRDAQAEGQRLAETTVAIVSSTRALRLALQVLILGFGAYFVLRGQLTAGGMIAGSIILSRALAPIERSIGGWRSFVSARTAHRNLSRLLGAGDTVANPVQPPRPLGRLEAQELQYRAPGSGDLIIDNVSFALEPGQTCAVVGPSGAGKSSLCRLLVGAWKPSHGHVRLDSAEIATWDAEDRGRYLGYLPQQVELFPGTVAENIARLQQVESAPVIAAAKLAGIHEMILHLPDGYQTVVGLHGTRISLGQRQRIGLARALFGDPPLIILDEPNSNLDSDGDQALLQALSQLKQQGRTILIVSHQVMPLQLADKILVLKEGSVAMFNSRDEVLKTLGGGRRHMRVVSTSGMLSRPARGPTAAE
ncbi:type I secretion system permease/ATPase [Aminobacter sp. BE322]|uniref:type I secretion system permease/ATPase n=1 Tax=unclassified Aminobacter TaxID=2644704 RepID=UPI003D20744D